jgi:hypothetical protein
MTVLIVFLDQFLSGLQSSSRVDTTSPAPDVQSTRTTFILAVAKRLVRQLLETTSLFSLLPHSVRLRVSSPPSSRPSPRLYRFSSPSPDTTPGSTTDTPCSNSTRPSPSPSSSPALPQPRSPLSHKLNSRTVTVRLSISMLKPMSSVNCR